MGVVYRAHDERLSRDVALKVLSEGALADDAARKRFKKEALALSRLSHPNIASVYDFDTHDGVDFLVMELVPGLSLDEKIRHGVLQESETIDLGLQLAQGLGAAHREGIVHRDLKPGNLRVTPEGRLKILDFGLARMLPSSVPSSAVTDSIASAHAVAGTPPYMAPEQLRGEPADERTDVYGCGAVLYEMATGRRPFQVASVPMLTDAILHQPPPSPTSINPAVSSDLEHIILKALQKDPRDRYASCRELELDLKALQELRSLPTRTHLSVPVPGSGRRPVGRRGLAWGAASVVTLSVLVALFWLLSNRPVLSFAPRDWILVSDVQNETGDPVFDRSLTTALRVGLEQSTVANVFSSGRTETTLKRMGRKDVERVDEKVGREICQREGLRGLVTASISQAGSRYALTARLVDPATGDAVRSYLETANGPDGVLPALESVSKRVRHDLGESLATMRQVDRPLPQVTTSSLEALQAFAEGNYLFNKGKHEEGVQLLERAVALDPDFAKAHGALGMSYTSFVFNERPKGLAHYETALKLADRITERERLEIEANYQSALGHFEQASQLYNVFLSRYPDELRVQSNYANLLRNNEHHEEAIARSREVLRLDPGSAASHISIATSLSQLGRAAEALQEYERGFALEPTWLVSSNLNHEYGLALIESGDHAKARAVYDKALATPGMKAKGLRSHALLDMLEGRFASARARLQESALVNEAAKETLSEARDRLFLSIVLGAEGDRAASLRQLEASAGLLARTGPQPWMAQRLGVSFARAGDAARARKQLDALRAMVDKTNPRDQAALHRLEGRDRPRVGEDRRGRREAEPREPGGARRARDEREPGAGVRRGRAGRPRGGALPGAARELGLAVHGVRAAAALPRGALHAGALAREAGRHGGGPRGAGSPPPALGRSRPRAGRPRRAEAAPKSRLKRRDLRRRRPDRLHALARDGGAHLCPDSLRRAAGPGVPTAPGRPPVREPHAARRGGLLREGLGARPGANVLGWEQGLS